MDNTPEILNPMDGDMMSGPDGIESDGFLYVPVLVSAQSGLEISVDGSMAEWADGVFRVEIPLRSYRNEIIVESEVTGFRQVITVYWLKNFAGKYRLSLDDNIWFLMDIASHASQYRSIFDNPYLDFFKKIHDAYGTKIHINKRTIWRDNKEDIIFFRSAIILDCHALDDIPTFLDEFQADPHRSGFVDLLIHEQYFYQDYVNHQTDYRQKVLAAVKWAQSRGYEPAFLEECVYD